MFCMKCVLWVTINYPKAKKHQYIKESQISTRTPNCFKLTKTLMTYLKLFSPICSLPSDHYHWQSACWPTHYAFCKVPTKRTFIDHKLAQQRGEIAPYACFSSHDTMVLTLSLGRAATIAMNSSSVTSRSPTISSLNTCEICKMCKNMQKYANIAKGTTDPGVDYFDQ